MGSIKPFLKKVTYAVGANAISLIVSLMTTLILPRFFGVNIEQYGYLQIYLFYVCYIGFFHFGLCDGIYLRDAGKEYESLDKSLYSAQFWLLVIFECLIALIFGAIGVFGTQDGNYSFIWLMVSANILLVMPRTMIQYFLQTTKRIKEYSVITTLERAIYGVLLIGLVLSPFIDYRYVVLLDVFSKLVALIVAIIYCRDIVFTKPCNIKDGLKECKINVQVGLKLMFANIASMLITGIVRWGIQNNWDVATYGKISFTLSVTNFLLTFISAIGLVLYPTLRGVEQERLPNMYQKIRDVLMIPLLGCLVIYYPMVKVLSLWLPQYAESMRYMAILFPLCVYASKMTMLVQTYMNVYRMEKQMLIVNCAGVVVAILTTVVSVFLLNSLTLAIISMVVNQMFRCVCAEIILSKKIKIPILKDTILEIILTVLFIVCNWFIGGWIGVGAYLAIYLVYCGIEWKKIKDIFRYAKSVLKSRKGKEEVSDNE